MKELSRAQLLNLVKPTKREMEVEKNRIEVKKFAWMLNRGSMDSVERELRMYQEIGEIPPGYDYLDDLLSPYGGD